MGDGGDTQPVPRRRRTALLTFLVLLVVVMGAVAFLLVRRAAEQTKGRVTAGGTPVGSFAFAVDDCASGHAFVPGFFGVDLRGQGGHDLRVVDSGDEAQLWLYPPRAKSGAILIRKNDCARWDVLVDWAHVTVNRIYTVSGHVHVACTAGGGTLTADVDFERCAF